MVRSQQIGEMANLPPHRCCDGLLLRGFQEIRFARAGILLDLGLFLLVRRAADSLRLVRVPLALALPFLVLDYLRDERGDRFLVLPPRQLARSASQLGDVRRPFLERGPFLGSVGGTVVGAGDAGPRTADVVQYRLDNMGCDPELPIPVAAVRLKS